MLIEKLIADSLYSNKKKIVKTFSTTVNKNVKFQKVLPIFQLNNTVNTFKNLS